MITGTDETDSHHAVNSSAQVQYLVKKVAAPALRFGPCAVRMEHATMEWFPTFLLALALAIQLLVQVQF